VISVHHGRLAVILDTTRLADDAVPSHWRGAKPVNRFKVLPEATWAAADTSEVVARWDQLKESYFSAVDKAVGTSKIPPWWPSHDGNALQVLRDESGKSLPGPVLPSKDTVVDEGLLDLIDEFVRDYPESPAGREHIQQNLEAQASFRKSFADLKIRRAAGEDITDQVLVKLLPHSRNSGNLARGAWTTPAPVLKTDIKKIFENGKRAQPEDWPVIANLIMNFFESCEADSDNLNAACQTLAEHNPPKAFSPPFSVPD